MTALPPVVWITSYPKSGNTWVRNFLYRYLWGEPAVGIGSRSLTIERLARDARQDGVDLSQFIERSHEEAVGSVWPAEIGEQLILKTHFEWSSSHPGGDMSGKAVLIVRDPKDVLISAFNFLQMRDRDSHEDAESFVQDFMDTASVPNYLRRGYGTWQSHPITWLNHANPNLEVMAVGYRSLLEDTHASFAAMTEFVFGAVDSERLDAAIEGSSFENLRQNEIDKRQKRGKDTDKLFFDSGKSGRTIAGVFELDLDDEFDQRFSERISEVRNALHNSEWAISPGFDL